MSRWTHAICWPCWERRNPGRQPIRLTQQEEERCCFCPEMTRDGIYVRRDPNEVLCGGVHPGEDE